MGAHRVKLAVDPVSSIEIAHRGGGVADLFFNGQRYPGAAYGARVASPGSGVCYGYRGCVFSGAGIVPFRVSGEDARAPKEIVAMVESVATDIHAISITSGVLTSIEEEEAYVLEVFDASHFVCLPVGVSIYPTQSTPDRLRNSELLRSSSTLRRQPPDSFAKMCPGLDYDQLWQVLIGR